jgi:hypothetical protein
MIDPFGRSCVKEVIKKLEFRQKAGILTKVKKDDSLFRDNNPIFDQLNE